MSADHTNRQKRTVTAPFPEAVEPAAFLDRDLELAQVEDVFQRALAGRIAMAEVRGAPGIGKSRLLREFLRTLPRDRVRRLDAVCRAEGRAQPFLPFIEMFRAALHLPADAVPARIQRGADRLFARCGLAPGPALRGLSVLLDESDAGTDGPDVAGARVRQGIVELIAAACRQRPVVLTIENLHLADAGTLDVIERLLTLDKEMPLLLLVTCTPDFQPAWLLHARAARILPKPLGDRAIAALVTSAMRDRTHAPKQVDRATATATGNPLHAEQIGRLLARTAGDAEGTDGPVIPRTLHATVAARIAALGPDCRRHVEAASVMGTWFDPDLIEDVIRGGGPAGPPPWQEAIDEALILPLPGGHRFAHPSVQQAIRETLTEPQRRALHGRIARALDHPGHDLSAPAIRAHHFDGAGMADDAVRNLVLAGRRNLSLFALESADDLFQRAMDLIEENTLAPSPAVMGRLFSDWFEVLHWRGAAERMISLSDRHRARLAQLENAPEEPHVLTRLGVAHGRAGRWDRAAPLFERARAMGERSGAREAITEASLGLMAQRCATPGTGFLDDLRDTATQVVDLWDGTPPRGDSIRLDVLDCWGSILRGDVDRALEKGSELQAQGKAKVVPAAQAHGALCMAIGETLSGDWQTGRSLAIQAAQSAASEPDRLMALCVEALCSAMTGDAEGGLRRLRHLRQEIHDLGLEGLAPPVDAAIGFAQTVQGDLADGVLSLENAIARARTAGAVQVAAMGHFALGTIYRSLGPGGDPQGLSTVARNAGFLIRRAPFARSRSLSHFDRAAELGRGADLQGVVALALRGRAITLLSRRRPQAARAALEAALTATRTIWWSGLARRIENDLTALG